ncbi:MAG: ABC transporter permease, partial [Candidatus Heimdallarchaeota archaeon]
SIFDAIYMVLLSILFSVISILLFILIITIGGFGINVLDLFNSAVINVLTDPKSLFRIFYWATPLMLTGLAVAVAFQAGLFNIGGQGQMLIGGVAAAIWAAALVPDIPLFQNKFVMISITIIIGFLFGGLWGFIPGYLKAKTGAHEVIVTIMMNLIAISLVTYLVGSQSYSPFVDSTSVDAYGQTDTISEYARINLLLPSYSNSLNWTTIITFVIVLIMQIILFYTRYGFKLRAVGFNPIASKTAGINSDRIIMSSMFLSGGLAGLAGVFYVIGTSPYRYVSGFEGTLGFDGIAVALIAQNSPIAIAFAAIFFGFLTEGKNSLDRTTDIPPDILFALQAFVIIFIAAPAISRWVIDRLRAIKKEKEDQPSFQKEELNE